MEWISVNDKLPKHEEDVLCAFLGWDNITFQRVLSYDTENEVWYDWEGNCYRKITHWMELPSEPKN